MCKETWFLLVIWGRGWNGPVARALHANWWFGAQNPAGKMGPPVTGDWLVFTVFLALHQRDDPGSQMDGRIESKEGWDKGAIIDFDLKPCLGRQFYAGFCNKPVNRTSLFWLVKPPMVSDDDPHCAGSKPQLFMGGSSYWCCSPYTPIPLILNPNMWWWISPSLHSENPII